MDDIAERNVADVDSLDSGAINRSADAGRGKLGGRRPGKTAAVGTDRGTDGAEYYNFPCFGHVVSPRLKPALLKDHYRASRA
jgi:hypothetical protein